ncbi:hypothetical protein GOP47_0022022 [Adiantum capillus-veneris]|uniref:Uncharacterized protein n=1 Tax=Adiantum capillus-veneris TaxID=13818 RepID=A0A9D4Z747_ADICA|nr:hypothetical protein GOP47_0022022 [Adiantum capillus-veneris]
MWESSSCPNPSQQGANGDFVYERNIISEYHLGLQLHTFVSKGSVGEPNFVELCQVLHTKGRCLSKNAPWFDHEVHALCVLKNVLNPIICANNDSSRSQSSPVVNDRLDNYRYHFRRDGGKAYRPRGAKHSPLKKCWLKHHEAIEPILINEKVPNGFPHTVAGLATLSGHRINILLNFYGLPLDGNLDQWRHKLARFLGIFLG